MKSNDAVSRMRLLQKYKGLVFHDIDEDITYTISSEEMYWKRGRNGGWHIMAEPPEYDGNNDDVLEPYEINDECLLYLISEMEQPRELNVEKIMKDASDDGVGSVSSASGNSVGVNNE